MLIKTEDLKNICQTILTAVDSNELSVITETLELKVTDNIFYMNVTNREYYAQVKFPVEYDKAFHATVNATVFLKLVSQVTTENVELDIINNSLVIKANGVYKLPLIYEGNQLLDLPTIDISNPTTSFETSGDILDSILTYNSKQISIGIVSKPVQKMYYMDEQGALTFTSGACINNFTLEKPIKVLFNSRLVKLFKLFKGKKVTLTLGQDTISDTIIQTKIKLEAEGIMITAILFCDDAMINSVPVDAIRSRGSQNYPYSATINKNELLETINRLMLFAKGSKTLTAYCTFKFQEDSLSITDLEAANHESINYSNHPDNNVDYTAILDLNDIKGSLDGCQEEYVTFNFGDEQAIIITRGNVINVIPEVHIS